jgi:hypothetical protein
MYDVISMVCSFLYLTPHELLSLSVLICIESEDRAFEHDVTVAMLVFQFKIILTRLFWLEHQHGRHDIC